MSRYEAPLSILGTTCMLHQPSGFGHVCPILTTHACWREVQEVELRLTRLLSGGWADASNCTN